MAGSETPERITNPDFIDMDGLNLIDLDDEYDEDMASPSSMNEKTESEETLRVPRTPIQKQKFKIRLHSVSPLNKGGLGETRYEDWESTRKIPGKRGNKKKWKEGNHKKSKWKCVVPKDR
jgi:hypothetical protein